MSVVEKCWFQLQDNGERQTRRGMSDLSTQLLTIDQLAESLGITARHVHRLVAKRRLPYYKVRRMVRSIRQR
jgi:excisionase family DNA binding protein